MSEIERRAVLVVFLGITVFSAVAVVGANIGWFGQAVRESTFATYGFTGIILGVVGATITTVAQSYYQSFGTMVSLDFSPIQASDVDLNVNKCSYEIREDGRVVKRGNITVASREGGWECMLPKHIKPEQVVSISLSEKNGTKWHVKPFYPLFNTQKVVGGP